MFGVAMVTLLFDWFDYLMIENYMQNKSKILQLYHELHKMLAFAITTIIA